VSLRLAIVLALGAPLGAAAQLSPERAQLWHPATPGLSAPVEAESHFGRVLALGDFDGDGAPDLAISMPTVSIGGDERAGAVVVLYGGPSGPVVSGHQVWTQDAFGSNPAEPGDFFGWALAAGDFDGDGFSDLAVGTPLEDFGAFEVAGVVQVLYGSPTGLVELGSQSWNQGIAGVADDIETGDGFGAALAAADFDGDGHDDLAIGAPGEDFEGSPAVPDLGALHVLAGSPGGLVAAGSRFDRPGDGAVGVPPEPRVGFGGEIALCRFALSASPGLAVGMPHLRVGGIEEAGGVVGLGGPLGAPFETLFLATQDSPGVPDQAEEGDLFGQALACGDFDRDGSDDVAIAAPYETVAGGYGAGLVVVFETGDDPDHGLLVQGSLPGTTAAASERFGSELAAGDFDADGVADLAVGSPGELVGGVRAGAVFALRGTDPGGLTSAGLQVLTQATDPPEPDDQYGSALAARRLSGHSGADLVVGVDGETVDARPGIGAVEILFSIALFRDGFASGDADGWSATTP
jgi:hypothetical protein